MRQSACRYIILAGFILTLVGFYPGLTSPDSDLQLAQAQNLQFSDHHPVFMALVWAGTNRVLPGPLGFFLLLLAMYWTGFLLICGSFAIRSQLSCVLALAIPFLPFVINFSGTLWKDALSFDSFLLAAGVMLHYSARARKIPPPVSVVVFVLLLSGALARHNSALSAIPLAMWLFWPDVRNGERAGVIVRRAAAASLAVVLAVAAANVALVQVLRPERTYPINMLTMFDLVAISKRTGSIALPGRWTDAEGQAIRDCYDPQTWDTIWQRCEFAIARLKEDGRWPALWWTWMQEVKNHPGAYAAHRLAYVGEFFQTTALVFNWRVSRGSAEHGFTKNLVFRGFRSVIVRAASTFPSSILFSNAFWFLAAPTVFVFHLWRFRRDRAGAYVGLLVSASGVLYTAPLALVGVAADFRYVYWGIGASCLATVLAVDAHVQRQQRSQPASAPAAPLPNETAAAHRSPARDSRPAPS